MSADYDRPTPLDLAVAAGESSLVELLLASGAQPNAVHNCVGSALHVVVAPSIGSRPLPSAAEQYRVVELLLEHDADVNLSVPLARGASVKSPLVEFLRYYCARLEMEAGGEQRDTTEQDAVALVHLLLSYGAVVVLKAGQKDPRGQLGNLRSLFVMGQRRLYQTLVEFGENYDRRAVRRLAAELADDELTERAASPSALKHLCRLSVRRSLCRLAPAKVESLQLPASICRYLLFGTQQ